MTIKGVAREASVGTTLSRVISRDSSEVNDNAREHCALPASHSRAGASSVPMNPRKFRLEPSSRFVAPPATRAGARTPTSASADALRWVREFFTADFSSAD
jgi:hypothetical protein